MKLLQTLHPIFLFALTTTVLDAQARVLPEFPPQGKIRVVIDTDAANEIDDQHAITLALLSPERFQIEGFVAANFGDTGGEHGVDRSFAEIKQVLEKAHMAGKYPVKHGSDPLRYSNKPENSEGVDFIIERAMDPSQSSPLWVIGLGAATDIASAYLKEPRIKDRVVVLWHGRTQWPEKCWNFNVYNDVRAARVLFASDLPFILFDTGAELTLPMAEDQARIRPLGELGQYLYDIRFRNPAWQSPTKGIFDLGDIAALVQPPLVKFEMVAVPSVNWDLAYDHQHTHGRMVRIYSIDREGTLELLESRLRRAAASGSR